MNNFKIVSESGSYVQDQRHEMQSQRYNPIKPSAIGEAMESQGLSLVSLQTGRARHMDKIDFQRTLARYRGPEIVNGHHLDIIYDSRKLGRGTDRLLVGIYRIVCSNGLVAGSTFFQFNIRHSGNTKENLDNGIAAALSVKDSVAKLIQSMQNRQLSQSEIVGISQFATRLLIPEDALNIKSNLLSINRDADQGNDLWSVFNRIQENAMIGNSVTYNTVSKNDNGRVVVKNMSTRRIRNNTVKDVEFNQELFNSAIKLIA